MRLTQAARAALSALAAVVVLFGTVAAIPTPPEPGLGDIASHPDELVVALKAAIQPSREDAAGAVEAAGVGNPPEPEPAPQSELSGAALAVADCESGEHRGDGTAVRGSWRLTVHNPASSASGAFQFLDGTWEATTGLPAPAAAHPLHVQLEAFLTLWDDGAGRSHWAPSRSCWGPILGY